MTHHKYISTLVVVAFFFTILLSGCAKDELIPPADSDSFAKELQFDESSGDFIKGTELDDNDVITDDEDDEDDNDRSVNN